ncbi:MAG: alpha-glucosidase [Chitinophagales bacterium]
MIYSNQLICFKILFFYFISFLFTFEAKSTNFSIEITPNLPNSISSLNEKFSISFTDSILGINAFPNQKLVEFSLDKSFILAEKRKNKVKDRMASYHFKHKTLVKCEQQVITNATNTENSISITGKFKDCDCAYQIDLEYREDESLDLTLSLSDTTYNYVALQYLTAEDEHFFGFGEQYAHFDMKGKKPTIFSEEQGIGRGDKPISFWSGLAGSTGHDFATHKAIPFYISTGSEQKSIPQRAMFVENRQFVAYDFTEKNDASCSVWHHTLTTKWWAAESPLDLIEKYTAHTGRLPELPDWAYGTWLGLQGGSKDVLEKIAEAKAADNPVSVLWIQDWVGKRKTRFGSQLWWNWKADEESYPNFKQFCEKLNEEDVKVLGYVNSFLANERELVEQAKANNYLIKNEKGENYDIVTPGFPAYLVDLSNPAAFEWLKKVIINDMINMGLSGWMADYADWLPLDCKPFSGESAWAYHNAYPVEFARLNREAVEEAEKLGEIVFFMRTGHSYSNRYSTLFWLGDQMVNWGKNDGLPSTVPALLSSGMSGISLNHSDIGGFTTVSLPMVKVKRSRELLCRWSELNAFTPIFRTHEGLMPEKNAQVYSDEEAVDAFAKMGRLHFALKPYFKILAKEAAEKGYPVLRALYLHYPDDAVTYDLMYQFLVGSDLLVFPVLEKGAESVKGYFPAGKWKHIWTNEVFDGGKWTTVNAPLGQPAAFLRVDGSHFELLEGVLKE